MKEFNREEQIDYLLQSTKWHNLPNVDLMAICGRLGIIKRGKKRELIARIEQHIQLYVEELEQQHEADHDRLANYE